MMDAKSINDEAADVS